MAAARIGIVGGYGQVGRAAAAHLAAWGLPPALVGGRDPVRTARAAERVGARPAQVDVTDPGAVKEFCASCDVVVNCAGPARTIGAAVARAALACGTGYVDAAGDDPLHAELRALPWTGDAPAIVSAGMMPGLSGLLPRLLARDVPNPVSLRGYVGGLDTFTRTAAADYLGAAEAGYGSALSAWRGGVTVRGMRSRDGVRLRSVADSFYALPYLSTETERLARSLGVADADWWSIFAGDRVPAALAAGADVERLCAAARLDLFGRDRFQVLAADLTGPGGTVCAVLRAGGASELTGAVAGLAALAITRDLVPAGVHHLAEALDPVWAFDLLGSVTSLFRADGPVDVLDEEGAL